MNLTPSLQVATFAAGCFWGVEKNFNELQGVIKTRVGYTGGKTEHPTYQEVCSGETGHAEAVEVQFNPEVISYESLVYYFFSIHQPTEVNRQGADHGTQYRSAIFTHSNEQTKAAIQVLQSIAHQYPKPIATEIVEASTFFEAEEYHQQYLKKRCTQ